MKKPFFDNFEETFKEDSKLLRFAKKQLINTEPSSEKFSEMLDKIFSLNLGRLRYRAKRAGLIRNATIVAKNSQAPLSLKLIKKINETSI